MNQIVEAEIRTRLPEDFQLGTFHPDPLVFRDGSVLLINEHIHYALISAQGEVQRLLRPLQVSYVSLDDLLPIYREAEEGNAVAYFPDSGLLFYIQLYPNEGQEEHYDEKHCQTVLMSDLRFASNSAINREKDEQLVDMNFFYSEAMAIFYFIKTVYDKSRNVMINKVYSLKWVENMQEMPEFLESSESANRPIVQQTNDSILIGLVKNHEMIIRIEQVGRQPLRLKLNNFATYSNMDKTLNRMVSSIGLLPVEGHKHLMLLFNDELMVGGAQFLDISAMRMQAGLEFLEIHREDKSRYL